LQKPLAIAVIADDNIDLHPLVSDALFYAAARAPDQR